MLIWTRLWRVLWWLYGLTKDKYVKLFKANNRNTRKICEIYSNLTHSFPVHPLSTPWKYQKVFWCFQGIDKMCIGNEWVNNKLPKLRYWCRSCVFIANFHWLFCCCHCWIWTRKCLLAIWFNHGQVRFFKLTLFVIIILFRSYFHYQSFRIFSVK